MRPSEPFSVLSYTTELLEEQVEKLSMTIRCYKTNSERFEMLAAVEGATTRVRLALEEYDRSLDEVVVLEQREET